MQIFHKMITAIDIGKNWVQGSRARKFRGILSNPVFVGVRKDEDVVERLKELRSKLKPDVEDIVVTNFPMEDVLFNTVDVPKEIKKRELRAYAVAEMSRILNLSSSEMALDCMMNPVGKALVMVTKARRLNEWVSSITSAGFPLPDVVIPDVFKYLQLIRVPVRETCVLIFLMPDYSTVIVCVAGSPLGIRTFSHSVEETIAIVSEETGLSKEEIARELAKPEPNNARNVFESIVIDLPYAIEREIIFLLSSALPGSLIRDVAGFYVFCDPMDFAPHYARLFETVETFQGKIQTLRPDIEAKNLPMGIVGLLLRGGEEFGKNKLVQI
uniref:Type IV pilus assembly protein PilM n=1 Tax=Pseudothermotoga hypogea TaxID=57487 RepID=A0A832I6F2_9THEM